VRVDKEDKPRRGQRVEIDLPARRFERERRQLSPDERRGRARGWLLEGADRRAEVAHANPAGIHRRFPDADRLDAGREGEAGDAAGVKVEGRQLFVGKQRHDQVPQAGAGDGQRQQGMAGERPQRRGNGLPVQCRLLEQE